MRSRFAHFRVHADRHAWLDWAKGHDIHPAVVQLAAEHQRFLDDVPPRKWADVSRTLKAATRSDLADRELLQAALLADLPRPWVLTLLHTLDTLDDVLPSRILRMLQSYHTAGDLQQEVRGHLASGQTDALDNVTEGVAQIIGSPLLNHLIGNRQFDLDAFDALLADLPGDHRELLQERIGSQPAAARLLAASPAEMLRRYSNDELGKKVRLWAPNRIQQYRASLLANLVAEHLQHADALHRDAATMTGLGLFVSHLQPDQAEPLLRVIDARKLRPVYPKSFRRAGA